MAARRQTRLLPPLELDQTDRANLSFPSALPLVLRHRHEELQVTEGKLAAKTRPFLRVAPPAGPVDCAGEVVKVKGGETHGVGVHGLDGVLLLEEGDETGENEQHHEGGEEDHEGAVVGSS